MYINTLWLVVTVNNPDIPAFYIADILFKIIFLKSLEENVTEPRQKVRFFTHFLTYVGFAVHVYLLVPSDKLCVLYDP